MYAKQGIIGKAHELFARILQANAIFGCEAKFHNHSRHPPHYANMGTLE
jgi:hypothetical protein